jgi:xylulokinase
MKLKYLIGVDLGTSGTKAALYTVGGTLVAQACQEVPIYYPKPGVVEQENNDFYRTASETVRCCILQSGIDPRDVAAIAFDSQMAGIGSVDEEYRPATRFDSWLDMRCKPFIEWMDQEAGDRVVQLTGCPPTCDHGPKMLWWKNERPQEYRKVTKFVTPAAYVAGRMAGLSGEQAFMDYTFIHFSGFSDVVQGTWSDELVTKFGMDIEKLPRIVAPWEVIGEVQEDAAVTFGMHPGTLIAAGAGDTAANALGAGIVKPGMLFDVAGTAAVLAGCTDTFVSDIDHRALITMRSVIPGLWNPLAYIAGGGIALRWFRDQFYNTSRATALPVVEELYDQMSALAAQAPAGSDGLLFSPHLGGRICPSSPDMRGAWTGISWNHTQAHFFRSVLESVAYEYAYYLRILQERLPTLKLTEARVVGGGARSQLWNQIKANVLNVPYQRLSGNEFGTWGCALIAGKAAGLYSDIAQQAYEIAQPSGYPVTPNADLLEPYQEMVGKYIEMQSYLTSLYQ